MKISYVKTVLTTDDLMEMLKCYVEIQGLCFKSIEIGEFIIIEGEYKKIVKIPFKAKIALGNIKNNILNVKILNFKVLKVGVLSPIRNFALRKALDNFHKYGIEVNNDTLSIKLDEIHRVIPYFSFDLNNITLNSGSIEIEAENIVYDKNKKINNEDNEEVPIVEDVYGEIRNEIIENVPDKYKVIAQYSMLIPDIVALLWRLFKDKRVSNKVKARVATIIAYLAMPFDIIPDFIPFIGKIDDVAIAFYGLNAIINEVPREIIIENWQGDKDIVVVIKEGVKYISAILGSKNVKKLIDVIKGLFDKNKSVIKNKKCKNTY